MRLSSLAALSLFLAPVLGCNGARKAQEAQAAADVKAITEAIRPKLDALQKAVASEAPKVGTSVVPARADEKAASTALFTVVHGNPALSTSKSFISTPSAVGDDGHLFVSWPDKSPLQDQNVYTLLPKLAGAKDAPVVAFVHWPALDSKGFEGDGIVYAAPAKPGAFMVLIDPHSLASSLSRDPMHAPDPSERECDVGLFDGNKVYWATVSAFGEKDQPDLEAATAQGPATGSAQGVDMEMAWAAARIPELGPHAGVVVARQVK